MAPLMEVRRKGKELTESQAGETLGPLTELLLGLYFSKEKKRIIDKKKKFPVVLTFSEFWP